MPLFRRLGLAISGFPNEKVFVCLDCVLYDLHRRSAVGEAFYVKEIRTTAEGRQWALTSDGAWVSLVSGSGLALLQPAAFGDQFEQPPASPARSSAASCSSPARTGPPQAMVRRIQRRSSSHATAMPRVEC